MKLKNYVMKNKTMRFLLKLVLFFIGCCILVALCQEDINFSCQKLIFAAIWTGIVFLYSILHYSKIVGVEKYIEKTVAYKIMYLLLIFVWNALFLGIVVVSMPNYIKTDSFSFSPIASLFFGFVFVAFFLMNVSTKKHEKK